MDISVPERRIGGETLYDWVKRGLSELLGSGTWRPGQTIPSERRLAEAFGVSIGTVRKAVDALVSENVLVRHQGLGTFVATHDRNFYLFRFFHLCNLDGTRQYPEVRLREFSTCRADSETAQWLDIPVGDKLLRIRNELWLQDAPTLLDEILLPASRFRGMTKKCLEARSGTLYQLYEERFGHSVARTHERLRASAADAASAEILQVAPGHPLLHITRHAYTVEGTPIELRHSLVRTDQHEYARTAEGGIPGTGIPTPGPTRAKG